MPLILLQNTWILPQLRQVQSLMGPLYHLIWYSPKLMHLPVMSKLRSWLENATFTTELVVVHWFIFCLQEWIWVCSAQVRIFSSNPGKVHFEGLVHLLRYIRENETLGLNYYVDMNDALVSDLLRQAIIKNENQLIDFSDSSWRYFPDTGRSIGSYIIFIKVGQLTMAKMLQEHLLNKVWKASTIHHALQEWL